jgi:RNA polymerase-interacting CarD/CdnL/TRCF family regulator
MVVYASHGAGHVAARERRVVLGKRQEVIVLTGGDPIELAEIIRDSAHRESTLRATQLSPGQRDLFVKARQLLSTEIALARGVEPAEANAWIDEQLTRSG